MTDFLPWFRNKYGAEFPLSLDRALIHREKQVWSSEGIELRFPPMVPEFREEPEYAIAGEWGRGVNTYAFYWIEKRGAHRCFFRIFSGGVYGRPEEDSRAVVDYLAAYRVWRERYQGSLSSSALISNMGDHSAELVTSSGERISLAGDQEGAAWWDVLTERMP